MLNEKKMNLRSFVLKAIFGLALAAGLNVDARAAKLAAKGGSINIKTPSEGEVLELKGKCGAVNDWVTLKFANPAKKKSRSITFNMVCRDMPKLNHHWKTSKVPDECKSDTGLLLSLSNVPGFKRVLRRFYFIRPDIHFYIKDDLKNAVKNWKSFQKASNHVFTLRLLNNGEKLEFWVDGRFFAEIPTASIPSEMIMTNSVNCEIINKKRLTLQDGAHFLSIDISHTNSLSKSFKVSDISTKSSRGRVDGIPFNITPENKNIDVGFAKWLRQEQDSMSFYSIYYRRSAWDNVPETIIMSVPKRPYNYAYILCALDPDAAKKPEMTLKVARYRQVWDGAGATQADTYVKVDSKLPNVKKVGTVNCEIRGKQQIAPLFLVKIPLNTGELAGYLLEKPINSGRPESLSIEFTRKMEIRSSRNNGIFEKMPLGPQSSIHLFAVTLETAPMSIIVTSKEPGNILRKKSVNSLTLKCDNPQKTAQTIKAKAVLKDFFGKTTTLSSVLKAPPGESESLFKLHGLPVGWYQADFTFSNAAGEKIWSQPATFAILPKDTRKAGDESPYGIWWFKGSHNTTKKAAGPLSIVKKLGFRHILVAHPLTKRNIENGITTQALADHNLTPSMFGFVRHRAKKGGPTMEEKLEKEFTQYLKEFPKTKFAMICHETGLKGLGIWGGRVTPPF